MAYTTPPTFVSGDPLTAAELNVLGGDIEHLYGIALGVTASGAQVTRGSNQSLSDSTTTSISWTAEAFDFGAWWSSGTDIVVPAGAIPAGYTTILVHVVASVRFASNGTGYRSLTLYINGSQVGNSPNTSAISGETTTVTLNRYAEVASGDVITIRATQTSGGALNAANSEATVVRHAPAA